MCASGFESELFGEVQPGIFAEELVGASGFDLIIESSDLYVPAFVTNDDDPLLP